MLYADDLKFFSPVSSLSDCIYLQNLLNLLSAWCSSNFLSLCPEKFSVMSISHSRTPIIFMYSLDSFSLNRVSIVRDLGVYVDSKLSFNSHINEICGKRMKTLGLIRKITAEFTDPLCVKTLYFCYVRSSLEHSCALWSPFCSSWADRIERVQRCFTRFVFRRFFGMSGVSLPPYSVRCQILGLDSLESRCLKAHALFVAGLLLGETDAPDLLSIIHFYTPSRNLRSRDPLFLPTRRTLYSHNDPILVCIRHFNRFFSFFDYNVSLSTFRSRLASIPANP